MVATFILTRTFAISSILVGAARHASAAPLCGYHSAMSCLRRSEDEVVVAREPSVDIALPVRAMEEARDLQEREPEADTLNIAREVVEERSVLDTIVRREPQPESVSEFERSMFEQD